MHDLTDQQLREYVLSDARTTKALAGVLIQDPLGA